MRAVRRPFSSVSDSKSLFFFHPHRSETIRPRFGAEISDFFRTAAKCSGLDFHDDIFRKIFPKKVNRNVSGVFVQNA